MEGVPGASLDRAVELLGAAHHVVAMTGAGISAESGVPTFRDAQTGHWSRYRPEDLATPEAFARDPALVTRWYDERLQALAGCTPNPGHIALVDLEQRVRDRGGRFTLVTQNVDGLHQAAGSPDVIELHGAIHRWRCTRTGDELSELPVPLPSHPFPSPAGGLYRPGVVWFGEMLPAEAVDRATEAAASCDLFLSIGTSSLVYPAAGFLDLASASGASSIEINPGETPVSGGVTVVVRAPSGVALPEIVGRL